MDQRWERLQELFRRAADLPEDERKAFLAAECGDDAALRREVEQLLGNDGATLDTPIEAAARDMIAQQQRTEIGPYRVVRLLGKGGMGAVYLAERDDDSFDRRVAIKLVPGLPDSDELLRRFRAERRILASLEHPNIARLFDGDATEDGFPYLVMEYIEGVPIDRYCREKRLDRDARLDLFRQLCDAVQHAHRNLVVHRDIKPSNILVTADGTPKLLDFGIAKLLDAEATGHSIAMTGSGVRLMTPEYASPEQVQGEPIGTPSDVYSLGVLLYELLTERHPYELKERTLREIERVVGHEAPRASDLPEELDAIVMMALRKEPERRYAFADQLAEDLRRYQRNLPVSARPDTWGYRSGKFIRRHRAAVGFAAAMLAVIVGFSAFTFAQSKRIEAERDTAEQMFEFALGMFESADPRTGNRQDTTALELVEAGAERIRTELDDQPIVRARLLDTLGLVTEQLGDIDGSIGFFTDALETQRNLYGEDSIEFARTQSSLAQVYRVRGDYDRAAELFDSSVAQLRRLEADTPTLLEAMRTEAMLYFDIEEPERAEAILREAVEIADDDLEQRAGALYLLGVALDQQGDSEAALELSYQALEIRKELYDPESIEVAYSLHSLGVQYESLGRVEESAEAHEEALRIRRLLLPEPHPAITSSMNSLAVVLKQLGRYDEAIAMGREALEQRRKIHKGRDHISIAYSLNNLGLALTDSGREGADELFDESLAMRARIFGDDHPDVGWSWNNLGWMHFNQERWQAAADAFAEAKTILYDGVERPTPDVALVLKNYAAALDELDRFAEAEPIFQSSIALADRVLPADHPHHATYHYFYGLALLNRGRYRDAEPQLRDAIEAFSRPGWPDNHPGVALSKRALGECLWKRGRLEEAERLLVAAVEESPSDRYRDDCAATLAEFRAAS